MDSLIRRIKSRLSWQRTCQIESRVLVAAFGKHPGWDDHMEDIGLETDMLVAAKRILYIQGIAGNIEHGRWSELETKRLSIEFGHSFIWCREDDIVAGRLRSSRDGRGRTSYPMVVCAHCRRLPLRWVYDHVLTRLARLEAECMNSSSAGEVRICLSECQKELSGISEATTASGEEYTDRADLMGQLAEYPELGPGEEGLIRILYHIDREISVGSLPPADKDRCRHSALARVPLSGEHLPEALILWMQLLLGIYGQECGVLVLIPPSRTWLDLIVGEPGPAQLYCLRASSDVVPFTTAVPYSISPEFTAKMRQRITRTRVIR